MIMASPILALALPGIPEMVLILVIVLLLFGAKKLPDLARALGQSLGEFKKARGGILQETQRPAPEAEGNGAAGKRPDQAA